MCVYMYGTNVCMYIERNCGSYMTVGRAMYRPVHVCSLMVYSHIVKYMYVHVLLNAGMLSKSRGQVLRLSPVLHLLFNYNKEGEIPDVISEAAIKAAINFVKVTCEQTAMIAGRESVAETIKKCQSGEKISITIAH